VPTTAVSVADHLVGRAAELAAAYDMQAADAIHLATALAALEDDSVFASRDKRLQQAAIQAGLVTPEPLAASGASRTVGGSGQWRRPVGSRACSGLSSAKERTPSRRIVLLIWAARMSTARCTPGSPPAMRP
jgi:hypothetical protein